MSRKLLCWLTTLLVMLAPLRGAMSADAAPLVAQSAVRVERSGGGFKVELEVYVPVAPAQVWVVLTDFEHMGSFIPNLSSSKVIERSDGVLKVQQKGVARYGVFSTSFESVREIRLTPQREIVAHGVGGNIEHMDSVMQLQAEGAGTRLNYHAALVPGFWVPSFIGTAMLRQETAEQFSAMLQEMIRRQ